MTIIVETGYLGSWIAKTIAEMINEYRLSIMLYLLSSKLNDWVHKYSYISMRGSDLTSYLDGRDANINGVGIPNALTHLDLA